MVTMQTRCRHGIEVQETRSRKIHLDNCSRVPNYWGGTGINWDVNLLTNLGIFYSLSFATMMVAFNSPCCDV